MDTSLKRVEDVLGLEWGTHVDGQKLKEDGEAFKKKLSPDMTFENWKKKVSVCVILTIFTHLPLNAVLGGCQVTWYSRKYIFNNFSKNTFSVTDETHGQL